jgi:hypothetical protein
MNQIKENINFFKKKKDWCKPILRKISVSQTHSGVTENITETTFNMDTAKIS